jgi:DNA-binding transcriptional MerR regulator
MHARYTIGQAARLTGLSIKTIRFYANTEVVLPSTVTDSGYRMYSDDDVWRLGLVRNLRQMEFGLNDIRRILEHARDRMAVVQWHKQVLDLRIAHLVKARHKLDEIPMEQWRNMPLSSLHTILEGILMSNEERQAWLQQQWQETMIPDDAPEHWQTAFLSRVRESVPGEWTASQTQAWTELTAFFQDPANRTGLKEAVRPFWEMLQKQDVKPEEWNGSMNQVMERARDAARAGHAPASAPVQEAVDEWIALFAKTLGAVVDDAFMERFWGYAETVNSGPNKQLWDIMARIHPAMAEALASQTLLIEGLRVRQKR